MHHHLRDSLHWIAGLLVLAACPMDDDDDDDEANDEANDDAGDDAGSSSDGGSTGAPAGSVDGVVRRTSGLAADGDGIGTLYLGAFVECDHAAEAVGFVIVPAADLSQLENEIPFAIDGLTVDTVYLAAFLDDDENAGSPPLPDAGDPVLADDVDDGLLTCVEVKVAEGSGVVVELDMLEADE
ncbi:MAG TPA: hypothetical protein VFG69_03280 [Nannocystaceae bacterium]|nr:hypothetical protein [Nannocystaceae bacterium]